MSLVIPTDTFGLTAGSLKTFVTQVDAGRSKTCAFCADCGVRIYNATARMMSVKPGTLDDTSWLQPDGHYWLKRKQPWTLLAAHTPHYQVAD